MGCQSLGREQTSFLVPDSLLLFTLSLLIWKSIHVFLSAPWLLLMPGFQFIFLSFCYSLLCEGVWFLPLLPPQLSSILLELPIVSSTYFLGMCRAWGSRVVETHGKGERGSQSHQMCLPEGFLPCPPHLSSLSPSASRMPAGCHGCCFVLLLFELCWILLQP